MTTQEHLLVEPEKIAAAAAVTLSEQLVVPNVFRREGIEQFKGSEDDTINVKVEGVLPYRTYGWRNDRSEPIVLDRYVERKLAVTFGGDIYSGVEVTDEQMTMDLDGWTKLVGKQTDAVIRGLEYEATDYVKDAPYAVNLGVDSDSVREGLIRAKQMFTKLRVPAGQRTLLVGSDWETALLTDDKLALASSVGEGEAVSALREATLGRRYGFNIVLAPELPSDEAVAMVDSAFIFATGAPVKPRGVSFGANASYDGVAMLWIVDYDTMYRRDRSVVNTYKGFRHVADPLVGRDQDGQAFVSEHEHFVRAIKLTLDGTDELPDGDNSEAEAEFVAITGVGTAATTP